MLKPIVSMNQMAMNESIATTCCYVWNGTSLLGSASLPHGGQLKAGSSTTWYVWNGDKTNATEMNSSWLSWQGGHVNPAYAGLKLSTGVKGDWIVYSHSNDGNWDTLYDANGNLKTNIATAGFCDHKNPETCKYFSRTNFSGKFTHTGATSAHYDMTSGNKWLADHTAVQYSS